ncbi:MAG: T9SS type A sorting domain-containing protein [Lewinellaceae bacterium]|nr:T9SS type A sorting domain-containing protein [Lewinellaceae bacterium]
MKFLPIFFALLASICMQAQPTTSAPVPPPRNAADVISIYGEAYTNLPSINYNPGWGQSGTVDIMFNPGDGNLAMAYTNLNYQGTDFAANPQNASAMEYVHIDIWTSNATVVKFSPIDNSGVGAGEFLVEVPINTGQWSSVDLPKSAFTGMSWNSLFQLKFDAQAGVTPCDIYLDNIYFYKSSVDPATDATLSSLQVNGGNLPGFTPSANTYAYGVPGGGAVPQITLATPTNSMANAVITQATGIPGDATVLVTAANGTTQNTYTISYFFNSPATAAPTPTATNVISMFSDAYTDVPVDTWNTVWSQAVYAEDTIAGNPTKKYTNLGFNGIETVVAGSINATGMTYFHLDVWTPNMTELKVKVVSFLGDGFQGANGDSDGELTFQLTKGTWNQLHIPLADFTNAGLSSLDDLSQYIFTSTPFGSGVLFVDNVFFTTEVVAAENLENAKPRVFAYPNPAASNARIVINTDVKTVEIFNMNGQRVMVRNQPTIQLEGLESGLYLVKIIDVNGQIFTDKLIVK